MNEKLSLKQRLFIWMGKMAKRSDIKVNVARVHIGDELRKWQDIIPEDMLKFYNGVNGVEFFYTGPDGSYNGVCIVGLSRDSRNTFSAENMHYRLPYQKAKSYGEYFLNDNSEISPEADVLFFIGDDSAYGILLVNEDDKSLFYEWDNDGEVKLLPVTFTELIERGISRHFGIHWWQKEIHHENQKLIDALAIEPKQTKNFELTVDKIEELNESAYRKFLGSKLSKYILKKVYTALDKEFNESITAEEKGIFVDKYFDDASVYKAPQIKTVMKAFGNKKITKKAFVEYFRIGAEPVVKLNFTLKRVSGLIESDHIYDIIPRILYNLEFSNFFCDDEVDKDLINYTNLIRYFNSDVYLSFKNNFSANGDYDPKSEFSFELVVTKERAEGFEEGKTYDSYVLPHCYVSQYTKE